MTAKVVHVSSKEWKDTPVDRRLYIGRDMYLAGGETFKATEWANPYHINKSQGTTREWVLKMYEEKLRKELKHHARKISDLRDVVNNHDVLGCWCKRKSPGGTDHACHGDILVAVGTMTDERLFDWLTGRFSVLDGNSETR